MPTQEITDQLFFGMKHAPETPTLPNNTNGGDQMVSTFLWYQDLMWTIVNLLFQESPFEVKDNILETFPAIF